MNVVTLVADATCSIFLKLAAGVALLYFSRLCLAFAKRNLPTTITWTGLQTTTTSAARSKRIAVPTPAQPTELEEIIECGACHREIKSEPIGQMMNPINPTEIYTCEHCGARVSVPL